MNGWMDMLVQNFSEKVKNVRMEMALRDILQHEGQETRNLSWDIIEQYVYDGSFTSIGAEILRRGVQNRFGR